MTPNKLFDLTLRQQLYLEQFKKHTVNGMADKLSETEALLVAEISKVNATTLNELSQPQVNQLVRNLADIERPRADEMSADLMNEFPNLTEVAMESTAKAISSVMALKDDNGVFIPSTMPTFAKVMKNPISATGQLLQPFVDSMGPRQVKQTEDAVRKSWTNGQTVQQLTQAIRGTKAAGYKDGITTLKTRQAEAVARTSIQHVASAARNELYTENPKIIIGYVWISTLDGLTTGQCRSLDKKKFKTGKGPLPPIHINCRSATAPDMDDGLDFLDEGATRSALNGPVSADLSYYDWLKKQDREFTEGVLGKERTRMFLDEGLTPKQFSDLAMDKNFRPRNAAQMRAALAGDAVQDPAPGTKTGLVWNIGDDLSKSLGRVPTRAEVMAEAEARGINSATASTQYAAWKKDRAATPAPVPAPAPTPVPVPTPTPPPVAANVEFSTEYAKQFEAKLTPEQKQAITDYTEDSSLNRELRLNGRVLRYQEKLATALDGMFDGVNQAPDGTTVYRVMSQNDWEDFHAGKTQWTDKGYGSTTASKAGLEYVKNNVGEFFGSKNIELHITLKGKGIPLWGDSNFHPDYRPQHELLLPRNTAYKVVRQEGNKVFVEAVTPGYTQKVTPPVTKPLPAPVTTPTTAPSVATARPGMPASGATRTVWQTADGLALKLGREPTRAELLEATRALGLNDSTAGTQFSKWKNASPDATPKPPRAAPAAKPVVPVTPGVLTQAEKDAKWSEMKTKFDRIASAGSSNGVREAGIKYGQAELVAKHFDRNAGVWRKHNMTQEELDRVTAFDKEVAGLIKLSLNPKASFLDVMKQPKPGELPFSKPLFDKLTVRGQEQFTTARTMFENLVHPSLLEDIKNAGPLKPKECRHRGFYDEYGTRSLARSVNFDPINGRGALGTVIHEIAHSLEYSNQELAASSRAFLMKRSEGLPTASIYGDKREQAYKDKWVERGGDLYTGREYGNSYIQKATEIVTMGIERLANSPDRFYKEDPEYFEFMVRTLNKL